MEITYASENQDEAALRAAHPGRLRAARRQRDAHADAVQPAVGARQGRPGGRQDMFLLLYWPTYSDAGSDNL